VYTSFFGNLKQIPAGLRPVGIARGKPKFFTGPSELRLAPSWAMLKMTRPDYDARFAALLVALDPRELYESLGEDAVLLCWEKPGEGCHRRLVAEWFEVSLGVVVPELGVPRELTPAYRDTPWKEKASSKPPAPPHGGHTAGTLFEYLDTARQKRPR
jgi:hypothetical protein